MRVGNIHEPEAGVDVTRIPRKRRRHSDHVTLLPLRIVNDHGRDEEETPDNTTTDDQIILFRKKSRSCRCAANVDEVAEDEPHDPDCEFEEDTTDINKTPTNRPTLTATCDSVSQDELEDELKSSVAAVRATHQADDLLAAKGITSWIL